MPNLWYPIGIGLSLVMIVWSWQDLQALRRDPDGLLRRIVRGKDANFYLTVQAALSRVSRQMAAELAHLPDGEARQARLEQAVLHMPDKERVLRRLAWELYFRLAVFAVIGMVLILDLVQ